METFRLESFQKLGNYLIFVTNYGIVNIHNTMNKKVKSIKVNDMTCIITKTNLIFAGFVFPFEKEINISDEMPKN